MIEYDVALVDRGQFAQHSPLLVEVEKAPSALLGINLAPPVSEAKASHRITIESIAPGSIAERYRFPAISIFTYVYYIYIYVSRQKLGAALYWPAIKS